MPPKASKIQELKKKKKTATRTSPTSAPSSDQHDQNGTKSEERVDHDGTKSSMDPVRITWIESLRIVDSLKRSSDAALMIDIVRAVRKR